METRQKRKSAQRRSGGADQREAARKRTAAPRVKSEPPEVVYTQPKPFNKGKLILQLLSIVAVVLALTFGISLFFKVETVTVSGMNKYDAWTVREASGIEEGENLLSFGKAKAVGKIKLALPYVDEVRIGIKLPDTVNIEITELDVVYAIQDAAEGWWLIGADGRVVEQVTSSGGNTKLLGVKLEAPQAGAQAVAADAVASTDGAGESITALQGSDCLKDALAVVNELENNGVLGEMASIDVSDLGNIVMWYGQRYQVELGDTSDLSYKISCMKQAISQLPDYESGVMDVSFRVKTDQVVYTRFS